jgi:hypothetical protein
MAKMPSVFDLMNPAQVGAGFASSLASGMEFAREQKTRSALSAYAMAPSAETVRGVMQHDPMTGIKLGQYEADREKERMKAEQIRLSADLQRRAASGDKSAVAELAAVDIDAWNTITDNDRQRIEASNKFIGDAARSVATKPEADRAAWWDYYVDEAVKQGFNDLASQKGKYSPQALEGAIARSGQMDAFIKSQQPDWMVVPEGGVMVNSRDPKAVSQFGSGGGGALPTVSDNASYDAVAPGQQYRDPQGNVRTKPGGGGGDATGGFRSGNVRP